MSAKVLTDVWPDFSVIVCQVFHPRISEVSQTIVNVTGSAKMCHFRKKIKRRYGPKKSENTYLWIF